MKLYKTVTAPDLQIRGEPSHPDPEKKGGGGVGVGRSPKKNVSAALWASVWSNNQGGGLGGGRPLAWIHNCKSYC